MEVVLLGGWYLIGMAVIWFVNLFDPETPENAEIRARAREETKVERAFLPFFWPLFLLFVLIDCIANFLLDCERHPN